MPFTFKPAVYDGSTLYELPRPVLAVRIQDAWDFKEFKVPLAAGDVLTGHSRQGVDISIEGQVGSQAGNLKTTEQEMFQELETLRGMLNVDSSNGKFSLFLYYDAISAIYRKFKNCSTSRFEYDLSDKNLFTYSITIHADDPVIYTTAPGL